MEIMQSAKKIIFAVLTVFVFSSAVFACPWCRSQVKSGVYDRDFFSNLIILLLPLVILAGIGLSLYHGDKISRKFKGE